MGPRPFTYLSRREVLRFAAATPLLSSLPTLGGCEDRGALRMGPFPARAGQTHMSLWCEGEPSAVASATLTRLSGEPVTSAPFHALDEGLFLATFEDLEPDTTYRFAVTDGAGITRDGSFRTLPSASGTLSLATSSDIHPASKPYSAFGGVLGRLPHLYLGLGDQVYADLDPGVPLVRTKEGFHALYARTWDDPALVSCWSNVASLLVWDDHETVNDFYPTGNEGDEPAARAYERFQRSRSGSETAWITLDLGPAALFVLDTRSFRSPNGAADGPDKTMLGDAQRDALLAFIATSTSEVNIIASPTPFHPYADTGKDAWAHGFAHERSLILSAIADRGAERFVLVTGDQHWPTVVRNALPGGGTVLELQCTPIAAFARTPPLSPSPDMLYVGDGSPGFGLLEVNGASSPPSVVFTWNDATGEPLFTHVVR